MTNIGAAIVRAGLGRSIVSFGAVLLMSGMATTAAPQGAPLAPPGTPPMPADLTEPAPEPATDVRVRIENKHSQPFSYQIGRPRGAAWSKSYTVPPGGAHEFAVRVTRVNAWVLPSSHGAPGVTLRFAESGGWMMHKLTPSATADKKSYAYVVNTKGFGEIVEARGGVAEPLTKPGGEAARVAQLQANHCFYRP